MNVQDVIEKALAGNDGIPVTPVEHSSCEDAQVEKLASALRELDARVQAILRRLDVPETRASLDVGDIHIDDRSKTVTIGESSLSLSPKEYKLLRLLASEPGRVFSSDEIIAHLWPDSDRAAANDVKQYIHLLRNKLYQSSDVGNPIENIKGFGYRLNG